MTSIENAVMSLQQGKMVILVDDENRENEGDFVIAAQFVTPEAIAFMATHGRGLICLALDAKRVQVLKLPLMSQFRTTSHESPLKTAFTLSIEAKEGVSTGISAQDRAKTILTAINPSKGAEDLVSPGHVFPLRAQEGGVLVRAGHTEGSVDLAKIAGLQPTAVICEIMKSDGCMARADYLEAFSKTHAIPLVSIQSIIMYRLQQECIIEKISSAFLPTRFSEKPFEVIAFKSLLDHSEHLALVQGPITDPTLVRVHSECLTGDALGSLRCDCGAQLETSMRKIGEKGGVLVYLRQHEGRGIGLANKICAYALQDQGRDTVDANVELGFKIDSGEYGIAAQILKFLGVKKMHLLTNHPHKLIGLQEYGMTIESQQLIQTPVHTYNKKYLQTKKDKMGHVL